MKARLLEIARHGLVYGLGNVSQQLIGFILLPVYTSRLSTSDYGLLALLMAFSTLLGVLLGMGLSTTLFRFFFRQNDEQSRRQVVSTTLFWLIGVGVIEILAIWLTAKRLSEWIFNTDQYAVHLSLVAVTLALNLLRSVPLAVLRAQKRAGHYTGLVLSLFVFGIFANIYVVIVLEMGVLGILMANAVTAFLFIIVGLVLCRQFIRLTLSRDMLIAMLRYTIPLVPAALGIYILQRSDRWFLQHYVTLSAVGIYSLGYQFGNIITMTLVQPFQLIWLPLVFEMWQKKDAKLFYERMLTYFSLFAFWIGLGVSLFSKEVIWIATKPAYHEAYAVVSWITLSSILYGGYYVVNIGIFLVDKTSYAMWIVGMAAVVNIVLNFLLIPSFGAMGAAIATALSYLALFIIAWQVNRRVLPLNYEWRRISKILVAFALLMACGEYPYENIYLGLALKFILVIAYWGLLLLFRFFQTNELAAIRTIGFQIVDRLKLYSNTSRS